MIKKKNEANFSVHIMFRLLNKQVPFMFSQAIVRDLAFWTLHPIVGLCPGHWNEYLNLCSG